jgi:hypothetical protein
MRLTHRDYERLLATVLELHQIANLDRFREALPGLLLGLIRGDYFVTSDYVMPPDAG